LFPVSRPGRRARDAMAVSCSKKQLSARLRARRGDVREAEALADEAIELARSAGDQLGLVDALELLAGLAAAQDSGDWSRGTSATPRSRPGSSCREPRSRRTCCTSSRSWASIPGQSWPRKL
jgi:hypothetical protein